LILNPDGLKTEKYWELSFDNTDSTLSMKAAMEKFDELFRDSVRIRLRADVEVGAYLSGGLDSTTTVAYIKDIEPKLLNTFSVGFEEESYDESSYQNEAVKYFDTSHNSIVCSSAKIAETFPEIVWHCETPLMRTASAPMFLLSKLVREKGIKVVITGEGADEILGGYNIFKETKIRRFWANQPDSSFRPLLLKKLYPYLPQLNQPNPKIPKLFSGSKLNII